MIPNKSKTVEKPNNNFVRILLNLKRFFFTLKHFPFFSTIKLLFHYRMNTHSLNTKRENSYLWSFFQ